jgi:hypothetical protein
LVLFVVEEEMEQGSIFCCSERCRGVRG